MKKTLKEHKANIEKAINQNGQFSHNMISCVLRMVAADFGTKAANELVDEYGLEDLYGIPKVVGNDDL